MPRFVRKLDKAIWWDTKEGQAIDDLGADALKNARTANNKLSIYEFSTDEELQLILATLSSGKQNLAEADYCVFDASVFESAGVIVKKIKGATSSESVDEKHHDIVSLTAQSLAKFVCYAAHAGDVDSLDKNLVSKLIRKFISDGFIDGAKINKDLEKRLASIDFPD